MGFQHMAFIFSRQSFYLLKERKSEEDEDEEGPEVHLFCWNVQERERTENIVYESCLLSSCFNMLNVRPRHTHTQSERSVAAEKEGVCLQGRGN